MAAKAQEPEPAPAETTWNPRWGGGRTSWVLANQPSLSLIPAVPDYRHEFVRPTEPGTLLAKATALSRPDTIEKMEAAFSCNDTPFVDQVRLPVAALWHGRVRLTGFESDVTTANFVLGLPGAGTLPNLTLTGSGHLATHTPPSEQLVGVHLTFSIGGTETETLDNSGLHGLQHLARSGRTFFQSILIR